MEKELTDTLYLSAVVSLCLYIFFLFYKAYVKVHKQEIDPMVLSGFTFVIMNAASYYFRTKFSSVTMQDTFM